MKQFDVIVVGGGLAGLTMTSLLAQSGVKVLCVDRETPATMTGETFDGRTTAISYGSRKVLEQAGVWERIAGDACPIRTIQILDGDSPVLLEFNSEEVGGRIFGWIAENRLIRSALFDTAAAYKNARHLAPAMVKDFSVDEKSAQVHLADGSVYSAKLVIGADGRNSFTREWMGIGARAWSYRQRAVVCTVIHENQHDEIAIENFRPEGPFAILPMTNDAEGNHRSSVVWTEHGPERRSAIHYAQDVFDAALTERFPDSYGAVRQTGRRFSYPLGLIHAHQYIAPRMALVAEAAHGIHPIAGQGLNMGLRDIAALAELVSQSSDDPGAPEVLERYQRARRADNMAMAGATDTLNKLFSNDIAPVRLTRRAGLRMVARMPFAKQFFMRQAMGAAGILPAMIKDREAA